MGNQMDKKIANQVEAGLVEVSRDCTGFSHPNPEYLGLS